MNHRRPLRLLSVHAHPDDEASKGAATVAKYAAEGIRGVLVCCTGGEEGEILNPAVDTPEIRANLHEVRMQELQDSVDAIGYEKLYMLGYRDSGMKDTEANAHPDNFANAPFDEAVERLVRIIRAERPQVIITYGDDSKFYPHPDHVRVHEISGPAFDAAGDPDRVPRRGRAVAAVEDVLHGLVGPPGPRAARRVHRARRGEPVRAVVRGATGSTSTLDQRFTTFVDVGDFLHTAARRCSRTGPRSIPTGFWMRLPDDVVREVFPWEEFVLARTARRHGRARGRGRGRSLRRAACRRSALNGEWDDEVPVARSGSTRHGRSPRVSPSARARRRRSSASSPAGPDGDIKYCWLLEDGKLSRVALGKLDRSPTSP